MDRGIIGSWKKKPNRRACSTSSGGRFDFPARTFTVRDGKGHKDRRTMLPGPLILPLEEHLVTVRRLHGIDQVEGYGEVWLPDALDRKNTNAGREWAWQYVFPATYRSVDPRSGVRRRHHLDESTVQKAVKTAVRRTDLAKKVSCHTFRHCAASGVMPTDCTNSANFLKSMILSAA